MSLTSLILALLPTAAARLNPKPTKRERELEADVERLSFALDYWRSSWHQLWAENERMRESAHSAATCVPARVQLIYPGA